MTIFPDIVTLIFLILLPAVFGFIILIILLMWLKTYCSLMHSITALRGRGVEESPVSPQENTTCTVQHKRQSHGALWGAPQRGSRFNKADICLHQLINTGRDGMIYKAEMMRGTIEGLDRFICKISRSRNQKKLKKEVSIMQKLGSHKNLLQLVYWDITDSPYMLIMEYVNQGTLLHFLQVNKNNLCKDTRLQHHFTIAAYHIAHAMNHLRSKMVVHCNLALKNIMVHKFPQEVKVAEFSLARDLTSSCSRLRKDCDASFRWYPPEYFRNKSYELKGDVWSFGILLWEMQTFGASVPYPHLNTSEEVAHYVCAGYRNGWPEDCRPEMLQMMKDCWQDPYSLRPSFMDVVRVLENILENDCDYVDIDACGLIASLEAGN